MIKLRLKRFGKKREVSYRIVAAPSTSRRDGRPLEELGYYNPRTDETRLEVPAIVKRLQQGAQPTDTVRRILEKANVFELLKGGPVVTIGASTQEEPAEAAGEPDLQDEQIVAEESAPAAIAETVAETAVEAVPETAGAEQETVIAEPETASEAQPA